MMRRFNHNRWIKWIVLALMVMGISGCNTLASSVTELEGGYLCGVNQSAGAKVVTGASIKHADSARIGGKAVRVESDEIDPRRFRVVRVDMGEQPSGGYGLKLLSEQLEISADTARVVVEWRKPDPGMAQMQVLTYPCLHLKLEIGDYTRLEIIDQEGVVRHALDLN
ncbi:MAG: protease complex subunit PrcB family protein [Candidatus Thiodiazotropha sp. (ex Dulcina madagascariensis)]|nr:protease complex subunit PrcB family protein [Candidatus Thiodiazotropha sp. (ex Dulcina madagascariensis)]MCU7925367.1 protease complex subunit PrcB family protein [Candidatus Thiodiazotropha sp. (ex Dulcina madagascariensis)]